MPPNSTPADTRKQEQEQPCGREERLALDAAIRHPVFFTDRLKKAPEGVQTGDMLWASPVARGYVFDDGARRDAPARL